MNASTVFSIPRILSQSRALPVLSAISFITLIGDLLFWRSSPGISLGIFVLILGGLLVLSQPARRMWIPSLLLLATCVQTGIELSLSNVITLVVLLLVLSGEAFFKALPAGGARVVEAVLSLLKSPARWFSFGRSVLESPVATSTSSMMAGDNLTRVLRVLVPGLALSGLFAVLLSRGNAVFHLELSRIADTLTSWILNFDFAPARVALWAGCATLSLGLLWPGLARVVPRAWTQTLPRWRRPHHREAVWQSAFALLVLNALFFAANTIDAAYLWRNTALPAGVNASDYVHSGVWSLIFAVLLSALVLAGMFQQQSEIANSRSLKGLGLLWGMQNLLLIAGVFLRLKLYVDEYQLTEKRIYVGCFLALVTVGFLLLAFSIARMKGLHWLISANLAATFVLFFTLQFPDVAGAVARYNVARWNADERSSRSKSLDLDYLVELGPNAWPSLVEVSRNRNHPSVAANATTLISALALAESSRTASHDWRACQIRRERGFSALKKASLESPSL